MKLRSTIKKVFARVTAVIFIFAGLLFGKTPDFKPQPNPSVKNRITSVQQAVKQLSPPERDRLILTAQWGNWPNWGNWRNWNNWSNWNNWRNWGNWGNWGNF